MRGMFRLPLTKHRDFYPPKVKKKKKTSMQVIWNKKNFFAILFFG